MLVNLGLAELDFAYLHLLETFPKEEVKPKAWLEKMLRQGDYKIYGYQKEETILALALCYIKTKPALLDYLLVFKEAQGKGIGSLFLNALEKEPELLSGLIVEAESLDCAKDKKSYEKRKRRIAFYTRLGYQETRLVPTIFGTTYTLFVSKNVLLNEDLLKESYQAIYRGMVPIKLHKENIFIP